MAAKPLLLLLGAALPAVVGALFGLRGVHDPVRQQTHVVRRAAVAVCLLLACACLGAALGRLPAEQLRRFGPVTLRLGPSTVVVVAFLAVVPSGLTALLGSFTNVTVAVSLVFGAYAWIVGRAVRRYGIASIAVVGAAVLVTAACVAVDDALRSRPEPRSSDVFSEAGVGVSVAVNAGLDVEAAVAIAALLVGAALTVLACARLSTAGGGTR